MVEEDKNIIDIAKEMAGNERKIVDDFCKAFIAHKILNNENISLIFEKYTFCTKSSFEDGAWVQKYWFECRNNESNN